MIFRMTSSDRVHDVLTLAAALSRREREELAAELLLAVEREADPEPGHEEAWANEIRRRIDDALSGKTTAVMWEHAREGIRDSLRSRRRSA
jgi:putative addiction module component (TIGR02574 family)